MSAFAVNLFNVMDFGAKGDGDTDDTHAIQRTLNVASRFPTRGSRGRPGIPGGGRVVFPPGQYRISRTLRLPYDRDPCFGVDLLGSGAFPGDPRPVFGKRVPWRGPVSALVWKGAAGPMLDIGPGGSHSVSAMNFVSEDGRRCESLIRCAPRDTGKEGPSLLSFRDLWLNHAKVGIQVGVSPDDTGCSSMFFERVGMEDLTKGFHVLPRGGANYLFDSLYARLCPTVLSLPGGSGMAVDAAVFDHCGGDEGFWSVEIGEDKYLDEMDGASYRLARFVDLRLASVPRLLKAMARTRVFFDGLHEQGDRRSAAEFIRLEGSAVALNQAHLVTWPIVRSLAPRTLFWDSLRLRDSCLHGPSVPDGAQSIWLMGLPSRLHYSIEDSIQQVGGEAPKIIPRRNFGWAK